MGVGFSQSEGKAGRATLVATQAMENHGSAGLPPSLGRFGEGGSKDGMGALLDQGAVAVIEQTPGDLLEEDRLAQIAIPVPSV
jgi:hypothetical protein